MTYSNVVKSNKSILLNLLHQRTNNQLYKVHFYLALKWNEKSRLDFYYHIAIVFGVWPMVLANI